MKRRGMTLIELLIVVAMIAILSATSLATVVGPLREHRIASVQREQVASAATATAQLVADCHNARSIEISDDGTMLTTTPLAGDAGAVWSVDADNRLVREGADGVTTTMLRDIETVQFVETDGVLAVDLIALTTAFDQPVRTARSVRIHIGVPGTEVAP